MISIGGTQEVSLGNQYDPWTNGLGIFDMTTLNWTDAYDAAAAAYERPSLVSQFYANNSRYPIEWGDPELESIFTSPNRTATTNASGSSSNSGGSDNNTGTGTTTNGTANASGASGGSNGVTSGIDVKDVIGGVIGGIAALVAMIIFSLIFWRRCRYKRKKKRSRRNPVELVIDIDEHIAGEVALAVGRQVDFGRSFHEVPGYTT
jgi:hypothetical protein